MTGSLRFGTALAWAAISGALALAWEITWSRLFNVATGSLAVAFGAMLGSYLLGLAIGALLSRRWFDHPAEMPRVGTWVAVANITAFSVAPVTSWAIAFIPWGWSLLIVALSGALLGIVFPMICHRALHGEAEPGARLSYLYVANIIGSGFGSLFTGFCLMEWLGIGTASALLLALGHVWAEAMDGWRLRAGVRVTVLALVFGSPWVFRGFFDRLLLDEKYDHSTPLARVIESRHGVIAVDQRGAVYGNGAYDGMISTRLEPGAYLVRPYIVSALHEKPEDVLVIGVSSGVWTKILASHPQVRRVTAVEISSAYLTLIRERPEVSSILADPKVEMVIDDGRRWMRNHPERKFDFVVMNTSLHWREFSTAVLSADFLSLVRAHLKPGGIVMWNCTGSGRAIRTGMEVFPHTLLVVNNCVASDAPLVWNAPRWRRVLSEYTMDGKPLFDLATPHGREALDGVTVFLKRQGDQPDGSEWRWLPREEMQARWGNERIITDDNLGHEYPRRW